jgi:RNA polymerase sigma-70 factor (ECF subfamily)
MKTAEIAFTEPLLHENGSSREREEWLIECTLQGRHEAFGDLVQPHLDAVSRFARLRLRSDSEVEDVVQQAVLRAFRHLGSFRREASFKTWLCAIALNEAIHLRREQAVKRAGSIEDVQDATLDDPRQRPDAQLQTTQEVARLRQAVARLPEKYRALIQLRDLRELSVRETALSLSLSLAAVRTRHHRARKLLERSLRSVRGPSVRKS